MSNEEIMSRMLAPYGPQRPLAQLVVEVNRIYHSFEARDYNSIHPEITKQLPPIWREMVGIARQQRPEGGWRVLDFGCGTGFEAEQCVRNLPKDSIECLVCYDPSAEMLAECRKRVSVLLPDTRFTSNVNEITGYVDQPFNLLATNSLLHHLPEPLSLLGDLSSVLAQDAIWLAGHEPSARYYRNPECQEVYRSYVHQRNISKYLSLDNYRGRIELLLGRKPDPALHTARAAFAEGLFAQVPSRSAIGRLVDYHVVYSPDEAQQGRGLDLEQMKRDLAGQWQAIWVRTYSFMGHFYVGNLPANWARAAARLEKKYPLDGANFSSVWVREQ